MNQLETLQAEQKKIFKAMKAAGQTAQNCIQADDIRGFFNAADEESKLRQEWEKMNEVIVYLMEFELGYRVK